MAADVDIDFANRADLLKLIKHIPAKQAKKDQAHNTGVHIQPIPIDPVLGTATITFKQADDRNYFKLDLLNVSVYNSIRDQEHYDLLLAKDPPWHRLREQSFTMQLVHIGNYYSDIANKLPASIPQMALFLAAMRPSKKHLFYLSWKEMNETMWDKVPGEYVFKRPHAIAYAQLVALHMNIIDELN